MLRIVRQFLFALIALAIVGGTTTQLARSAEYAAATMTGEMPCDMAMPMADGDHGSPMVPCKGLTPDCMKQIGCVADVALPARFAIGETVVRFAPVAYWDVRSMGTGIDSQPEPLPPRAG